MRVSTVRESLVVEHGAFCWFEERFPLFTDERRLLNIRNRLEGLAWFVPRNGFLLTHWLNKHTMMVRGHGTQNTGHRTHKNTFMDTMTRQTQDTGHRHVHGRNSTVQVHKSTRILIQTTSYFISDERTVALGY